MQQIQIGGGRYAATAIYNGRWLPTPAVANLPPNRRRIPRPVPARRQNACPYKKLPNSSLPTRWISSTVSAFSSAR